MAIVYELRAKSGTYIKDGQEKISYITIGRILETKDAKLMLKMESLPMNWDGWAYVNTPQPKEAQQQAQPQRQAPEAQGSGFDDMPDDVPF
jgi:hypothetical protein